MKIRVAVRVYEELNDFLPPEKRKHDFSVSAKNFSSLKHLLKSLGVPPARVDLALVNGKSVSFSYSLQNGDRISAYPAFEVFDISGVSRLRGTTLQAPKFILDIHLGKLAKYLRILGFDTLYSNQYEDREIINLSLSRDRTILTRDMELLKMKKVVRGYWVRNINPEKQLEEIVKHFDLYTSIKPFSRCIVCNGEIEPKGKEDLKERIDQKILSRFNKFFLCKDCDRIYWKGSHYKAMVKFVDKFTQ